MPRRKPVFLQLLATVALIATLLSVQGGSAAQTQQVAAPFRDYYNRHQGIRVLGHPLSGIMQIEGLPAQYFEKGRIEDHRARIADPQWAFAYGLLTSEIMQRDPNRSVSSTNITYANLHQASKPGRRVSPPPSFTGGTMSVAGGRFVPYNSFLRVAPGYVVPLYFWNYINNTTLFLGGWLHDVGLPVTGISSAVVIKNGQRREISIQAFERAVLTYDPANPQEWQVERANIGADAMNTIQPQPTPAPGTPRIEIPVEGSRAILPLHILARVGNPGEQVTAVLRWSDGTEFTQTFTTLKGEDGHGVVVDSLDWMTEGRPPTPPTQPATLEIRNQAGAILASRNLTIMKFDDPEAQIVDLYWIIGFDGEQVFEVQRRRIPRTVSVGATALEELLWGPSGLNLAGFITALPTPKEVLEYPGRQPDWGPRVRLLGLTIKDGVATADFSKEMRAYGGGSARVLLIREQITRTLKQFPAVQEVRIAIEGQTEGVLEP
ncbi:MAG: GerMN domain-containing protein [Chloroflexia bacterium]